MPYAIGDHINGQDLILRRINKRWIEPDQVTVSPAAFEPRQKDEAKDGYVADADGFHYESGISCDVERLITEPVGDDYWVRDRKPREMLATCRLQANVPIGCTYMVTYDGLTVSHCSIDAGKRLFDDKDAQNEMASKAEIIHNPHALKA